MTRKRRECENAALQERHGRRSEWWWKIAGGSVWVPLSDEPTDAPSMTYDRASDVGSYCFWGVGWGGDVTSWSG